MMPLAPLAVSACLAIAPGADQIFLRDLAGAFPGMESAAPGPAVGLAPAPGIVRVFHLPELRRLVARFNLPGDPASEVCVVRPVLPPDPALFLNAMQKELPRASIEIQDYSRQAVPSGDLTFPASAMRRAPRETLWIGYIRYATNRRFTVWARVKLSVSVEEVVAASDLEANRPIEAGQLRVETREEPFFGDLPLQSIDGAIGRWPRAAIREGSSIHAAALTAPPEVLRGETVRVEVNDGGARLTLEARAESSGSRGEMVLISNPVSSRRFRARVEGKGRVSVNSSLLKVNP